VCGLHHSSRQPISGILALLSWSRYSRHIYKATTKIGCWDADGEERLCTGMLVRHAGAEAGSLDQVGAGQGC
jgi:hypothetical protein